jgi:hypothetical protein
MWSCETLAKSAIDAGLRVAKEIRPFSAQLTLIKCSKRLASVKKDECGC